MSMMMYSLLSACCLAWSNWNCFHFTSEKYWGCMVTGNCCYDKNFLRSNYTNECFIQNPTFCAPMHTEIYLITLISKSTCIIVLGYDIMSV